MYYNTGKPCAPYLILCLVLQLQSLTTNARNELPFYGREVLERAGVEEVLVAGWGDDPPQLFDIGTRYTYRQNADT